MALQQYEESIGRRSRAYLARWINGLGTIDRSLNFALPFAGGKKGSFVELQLNGSISASNVLPAIRLGTLRPKRQSSHSPPSPQQLRTTVLAFNCGMAPACSQSEHKPRSHCKNLSEVISQQKLVCRSLSTMAVSPAEIEHIPDAVTSVSPPKLIRRSVCRCVPSPPEIVEPVDLRRPEPGEGSKGSPAEELKSRNAGRHWFRTGRSEAPPASVVNLAQQTLRGSRRSSRGNDCFTRNLGKRITRDRIVSDMKKSERGPESATNPPEGSTTSPKRKESIVVVVPSVPAGCRSPQGGGSEFY